MTSDAAAMSEDIAALHRRLVGRAEFIRSLENATIKGTPMVPLHVDTMAKIAEEIEAAADTIERLQARVGEQEKLAFTFAFARGFQIAEETSRSCITAIDDAWDEWCALRKANLTKEG